MVMLAIDGNAQSLGLSGYWAEQKFDGCRCLATDKGLVGRSNAPLSSFPDLGLPSEGTELDGEIICDTFSHLQSRIHTKDSFKIKLLAKAFPAKLKVFDILRLEGEDLRSMPLKERRIRLEGVKLPFGAELAETYNNASSLFESVLKSNGEGIMLKRAESAYVDKRSPDWVKVKAWKELDVEILDYTSEKRDISALITDKGKVNFTGQNSWKEKIMDHAKLFAKVIYLELTPQGLMRFPKLKEIYVK